MTDNKEYGVIHEVGDYFAFKKLSKEDNEVVKEQMQEKQEKEKKENE